ncbi:integral membrane protein DUF6 [Lentinula aciculospora]|uniref:Integral membrane protein DUF6 n=1 Tax=Lentinula aciculospora TaxID=153920 RepID=A0A9W8ZWD7_9AGAR|nr:integral membrane protein DUF6 [Lentinula aciculospora]
MPSAVNVSHYDLLQSAPQDIDDSCNDLGSDEKDTPHSGRFAIFLSQLSSLFHRNVGLLLIVTSQAFLALVNVAVKKLNTIDPPVPTFELIFIRMATTYLFSIAYMKYTGVESPFLGPKGVRCLLMFRGFSGFFGLFGIYFSLKYLSLSDATVLTFLSPLCTAVAGALFLGENVGRKEIFAGVFSLIGVMCIARPTSLFGHHTPSLNGTIVLTNSLNTSSVLEHGVRTVNATSFSNSTLNDFHATLTMLPPSATPTQRLIAVGISLLGVLGSTGAYTSIRAIGKRAHALHSMVAFSGYSVIVSAIGLAVTHTPVVIPTSPIWLLLLLEIGVFGFCAQIFLTLGLQRETASRGTLAIYTLIVFTSLLDRIFFHSAPSLLSVLGTLIIVGSALWVVVTKKNQNQSSRHNKEEAGIELADAECGEEEILLKNVEEARGEEESISNLNLGNVEVTVQNESGKSCLDN